MKPGEFSFGFFLFTIVDNDIIDISMIIYSIKEQIYTVAMHFNSIAMGVGKQFISTVVLQG